MKTTIELTPELLRRILAAAAVEGVLNSSEPVSWVEDHAVRRAAEILPPDAAAALLAVPAEES